jgi:preprotein translocase subunit SecF
MARTLFNNFDFMALRKPAVVVSVVLLLISIISLVSFKLNVGIDFTGGSIIEVGYQQAVELEPIRQALDAEGFGDAIVQHFGSAQEVLIRLVPEAGKDKAEISSQIIGLLQAASDTPIDVRRVDFVGPQVGEELTEDGGLAVLYALIAILIYVAFRFEYRFSLGAVAALVHDVIITLGILRRFSRLSATRLTIPSWYSIGCVKISVRFVKGLRSKSSTRLSTRLFRVP